MLLHGLAWKGLSPMHRSALRSEIEGKKKCPESPRDGIVDG